MNNNTQSAPKVMIVSGEASGDMHTARLVRAFKHQNPDAVFYGIGGPAMRDAGVRLIRDVGELSTFGIFEVIKHLPQIIGIFFEALRSISNERPDVVVLVDYPDFNLRLARAIRWRYGDRPLIMYYIAPQVWIWRKWRAKLLAKLSDRLAVVLPFEKNLFEAFGARAHFVGHPSLEDDTEKVIDRPSDVDSTADIGRRNIALLPGSRHGELHNYMPPIIEAVKLLAESNDKDWRFFIIKAPTLEFSDFAPYLDGDTPDITITEGPTRELLTSADFAVVGLGTATLEAALAGTPALLIGKVSPLTYKFSVRFLDMDLEYYSLVNFILKRLAYPELIQDNLTGPKIAQAIMDITSNKRAIAALVNAANEVRAKLEVEAENGIHGNTPSERAASILGEMVTESRE